MEQNTRNSHSAKQNASFQPKHPTTIFGRGYSYLEQVYGQDGIAVIKALNELKSVEPAAVDLFHSTINPKDDNLLKDMEKEIVDPSKMSPEEIIDAQTKNLKNLSLQFTRNFILSNCETAKAFKRSRRKTLCLTELFSRTECN